MNDAIQCTDVCKIFANGDEELSILRGIDFILPAGTNASITGPSGCGKSTFLSILGGLDRQTSGTVVVGGVDLSTSDDARLATFRATTVGFVFQFHYLLRDFTALENVMLPAYMLTGKRAEATRKAEHLIRAVGLADRASHLPSRLSGGERQRIAIARALVNDPAVLLADEPTGNLDQAHAVAVEKILYSIARENGTTLLVVTHDQGMAGRADRRFVLSGGVLSEA